MLYMTLYETLLRNGVLEFLSVTALQFHWRTLAGTNTIGHYIWSLNGLAMSANITSTFPLSPASQPTLWELRRVSICSMPLSVRLNIMKVHAVICLVCYIG